MKTMPAYKVVYTTLKQQIRDGSYPVDSFLPTENELCQQFNVSKTTIRKAISLLSNENYIEVTQGRGTKVLDFSASQKLSGVTSFTETLIQKGYTVSSKGVFVENISADENIAQKLNIHPGDPVYRIQRVQCADGIPIAIMENIIVASLFPNFHTGHADFISLYTLLEEEYNLVITKAEQILQASKASFADAQILNIDVGDPLLISKRKTYTGNTVFDYSVLKINADKFSYNIYLEGR